MSVELWKQLADAAAIDLNDDQVELLNRYIDLLTAGNERMNLTRITDRASAEVQHIADALTLLPFLPRRQFRLVDVGSGGGVPGIPLAIVRDDAKFTLVEATKKKANFLEEAIGGLKLKNVRVVAERAEDYAIPPALGFEHFDIATARAVGAMDELAQWCLPLVKLGGHFLAMKGPKVADELPRSLNAIARAGGGPPVIQRIDALPGIDNHVVVVIEKRRSKFVSNRRRK